MQSSRQKHRVVQHRAMLHQVSPAQSPVLAQCFLLPGQGQVRELIIPDGRVGHVPAVHAILFLRGLAGLALLFSPSPSLH